MNTLLEKVAALIEINVRSLIGQSHRSKNAASFFRHYMAVEQNLINIEKAITQIEAQMRAVVQKGTKSDEQVAKLDRIVDEHLLHRNEPFARQAQRQWNKAKRINITYRAQIKELNAEREKLLRAKDKLEVQLMLMQEEKGRLQELYRQYQEDHGRTQAFESHNSQSGKDVKEKVYWVVDSPP